MPDFLHVPVVNMVLRSGPIARSILILLAFSSLGTWAIIFDRFFFLGRVGAMNKKYRAFSDSTKTMEELDRADAEMSKSLLGVLGKTTVGEYRRILADAGQHKAVKDWSFYLQNQFNMAYEKLGAVAAFHSKKLDHGLFLLAIASSVAPFLGLLGTVWGIMDSFYEIGKAGSASLPVVAPGIAEALITTVLGLVVAIPSVLFYNVFVHRAERLEDEMQEFGETLFLRLKRDIFNLIYSDRRTDVA